jgi:hypothetical protein
VRMGLQMICGVKEALMDNIAKLINPHR